MPNITLVVPEDVLRRARLRAAEQGTSVSAMVRSFLISVAGSDAEIARLERLQQQVTDELDNFTAADRVSREVARDRALR